MLLAALLLAAQPAPAAMTAPLPPPRPWRGRSERLIAKPGDPWITPSERTGLTATPTYAETRAWIDRLVAASPLLSIETFGRTPQGRDLYAVVARKGTATKPVLLAQAGIHSGEIDGKDAGLMLLRDIAKGGKDRLLDRATLVFVPVFNADGHERSSPFNRPNQRGPVSQGWRTTAENLNLNRDYLKADAPEMRAMIGLIRRWQPSLYLDLHVTDGSDHQHDITYDYQGWQGHYATSPAIGRWLDGRWRPAITRALKAAGHVPGLYVARKDENDPLKGLVQDADGARYSTGYGDLARVPTVLLETHSLKDYRRRVLGTYVFMEASLKALGDDPAGVARAIAADKAARPREATLTWAWTKQPIAQVDLLDIAFDRRPSAASGRAEIAWTGRPVRHRLPVWGQRPGLVAPLPAAWLIPPTLPALIDRVRLHGIAHETLAAPVTAEVDMVRLADWTLGRPDEGHVSIREATYAHERRTETFPPGTIRIPADQPLGLLAAQLIEPESPESLMAWGYFPALLQRTEYIEPYAIAPLADRMLAADPALKAAFDAKLAADPAFARDPEARLAWFYERTPYHDDRYGLFPVGRELR